MGEEEKHLRLDQIRGRVLITGGAGFIGSKLVRRLVQRPCKVRVLDVRLDGLKDIASKVELVGAGSDEFSGGMADRDLARQAMEDVEVVYHMAISWPWGLPWREVRLAEHFDANFRGTLNLLDEAKSQGVGHFLFASSIAVYGETGGKTTEETVCKPELSGWDPGPAYGILKLTLEKLCLMYHHNYGLPVTAFRIDVVFSDRQVLFMNRETVDQVRQETVMGAAEGEGMTCIHVDDVIDAFLLASLNERAYGRVFNLTNRLAHISDYELHRLIAHVAGSNLKIRRVKDETASAFGLSTRRARSVLGWKPVRGKDQLRNAIAEYTKSILLSSNPGTSTGPAGPP